MNPTKYFVQLLVMTVLFTGINSTLTFAAKERRDTPSAVSAVDEEDLESLPSTDRSLQELAATTPGTDGSGQVRRAGTVTVLGTRRTGVPLANVPGSITVVSNEEIEDEAGISNRMEDIIARKVPGFNPTNNGVRQIRGRTAQVFINGVPVNEQLRASSGSDMNLLVADQLDNIEVSRGANSAYGFGSPGGIIALNTPQAESEELTFKTKVKESFNPQQMGGSHQSSVYQSVSQIVGPFDYHLGGFFGYDGLEFDKDGELAAGFDNAALLTNGKELIYSADTNFGLDLEEWGEFRLKGTFNHIDFKRRFDTNAGVYRDRNQYGFLTKSEMGGESFRTNYTIDLTYENEVLGQQVKLEGFTSDTRTRTFLDFNGLSRDLQFNQYYGFRSSITTPLDFIPNAADIHIFDGMNVNYGFDFIRNRYFRPVYFEDTGALNTNFSPDTALNTYAVYWQVNVPVTEYVELTGGARHEWYAGHVESFDRAPVLQGGDIGSFNLSLFNGGITIFAHEHLELFGSISQGSEITQLGRAARRAVSADLIDPQPAKSNQYEMGLRSEWENFDFNLSTFLTKSRLSSELSCDGINPCTPLREPREFWGIEGSAGWDINKYLAVDGIFSWMEGTRSVEGVDDSRRIGSRDVPPFLATLNTTVKPFPWWRNTLQINFRGSRQPDFFNDTPAFDDAPVHSLILFNLLAEFDIGPGTFQIGVENLFNKDYTSIVSESTRNNFLWLPEEGTRITTAYSVKWG